jgi:hypothetical protein
MLLNSLLKHTADNSPTLKVASSRIDKRDIQGEKKKNGSHFCDTKCASVIIAAETNKTQGQREVIGLPKTAKMLCCPKSE